MGAAREASSGAKGRRLPASGPRSPPLPRRYGFVEFDDVRDADDAVYELNGKDLCGERVIVEHARGPRRDSSYGSGRSKHSRVCVPT